VVTPGSRSPAAVVALRSVKGEHVLHTPEEQERHVNGFQSLELTPMKSPLGMFRTADGTSHTGTFLLVCGIFVCTGLCNGMIDSLNKHFQNSFEVSKAASAFVQFFWYLAYFVLALPSGWYARRFGYRAGIVTGLALVVLGALIVYPAAQVNTFSAFLAILFLIASGLTFLETIANPYATVLGPAEFGVARINFAQSCNAIGWILGPSVIGWFVLSGTSQANTSNDALYLPYLVVAALVGTLAFAFCVAPVPDIQPPAEEQDAAGGPVRSRPLYREWHFTLAIVSQFLYCAGQTGIFSFFINFVKEYMPPVPTGMVESLPSGMCYAKDGLWLVTDKGSAALLSFGGFGLFMVGRFTGSTILRFARPHLTLGVYGLVNTALMAVVVVTTGWLPIAALLLSFFFMSIVYPTNFALGIRGLGERTKLASSFMVMAILGGALAPMLMGRLADRFSMRVGFVMPLCCFIAVAAYGLSWKLLFSQDMTSSDHES
jgi:FHS family L-fucose permease-like MFS transporter